MVARHGVCIDRDVVSRLLSVVLLVAVAIVVLRQSRRRRGALRYAGLELKRRSQANRAYWFALPPIERPK
jgi:hypothetical protein